MSPGCTTSPNNQNPSVFFMASQDFITIVILVSFLTVPTWDEGANTNLDVVEFFAGVARISRLAAWTGLRARAYDIEFTPLSNPEKLKRGKLRRKPMDLNGSAGLAPLVLLNRKPVCRCRLFHGYIHPNLKL